MILPAMREQGSGRIVNVSSIAGHIGFPMIGHYCATKFAVRGMSQALQAEVGPFGVHVSLIEPGRIRTNFRVRAEREEARHRQEKGPYTGLHRRFHGLVKTDRGAPASVVSRRIVHACMARRPRFHYLMPQEAKLASALKRLVPDAIVNLALRRAFRA